MAKSTNRVLSLDIFRGLVMAMMIVVNNQSQGAFAALGHKPWDGCTPCDLVFPSFLFIVGVSMWFSYRKTGHRLTGAATLRLLKRGALIFAVGLALHIFPFVGVDWGSVRIMGVLQRIGISFFVGGVLALWLGSFRRIAIAVAIILVGYWLGVELLGDATREGYAGCRIDGFLLGAEHLYRPQQSFDPEGGFSTIPAVATVLLGYMTGKMVGEGWADKQRVLGMLGIAGGLCVLAGLALNQLCPINKPIWSSSYVLYAGGIAMLLWMAALWFYDYRGGRFGSTFGSVFGTNTLFAYVLAGALMRLPEVRPAYSAMAAWLQSVTTPAIGSLLASVVLVGVIWLIVYPLYRKRIFIRL